MSGETWAGLDELRDIAATLTEAPWMTKVRTVLVSPDDDAALREALDFARGGEGSLRLVIHEHLRPGWWVAKNAGGAVLAIHSPERGLVVLEANESRPSHPTWGARINDSEGIGGARPLFPRVVADEAGGDEG